MESGYVMRWVVYVVREGAGEYYRVGLVELGVYVVIESAMESGFVMRWVCDEVGICDEVREGAG